MISKAPGESGGAAPATDFRAQAIAKDVQLLLDLLRQRARKISQTMAWEYVAMGVAEVNELSRCASDLAGQLLPPTKAVVPIAIGHSLKQMQTLLRTVAGSDLALSYEFPACDARVALSVTALEQMLINVVANARSAGATRVSVRVHIDAVSAEFSPQQSRLGFVTIEIGDNGAGLASTTLESSGTRFRPEDDPGWFGLGLNTVSDIARSAGGTIAVSSEAGQGFTVQIALPLVERVESNAPVTRVADTASEQTQRAAAQRRRHAVLHAKFAKGTP